MLQIWVAIPQQQVSRLPRHFLLLFAVPGGYIMWSLWFHDFTTGAIIWLTFKKIMNFQTISRCLILVSNSKHADMLGSDFVLLMDHVMWSLSSTATVWTERVSKSIASLLHDTVQQRQRMHVRAYTHTVKQHRQRDWQATLTWLSLPFPLSHISL